ncbi:hypothetical protein AGDE_00069 [Angomonas deanei]|nr:hypothetical protein AGDE_08692 [Angomonas deanei]EPY43852.1 hypothetical protein AGDE_00069 [Angomonas deanei]|eukprot:EPY32439.1 hypothetical protein AGDE_08692 [Angomonas deanei]
MADSNADYNKQSYWESRYKNEEQYDWFPSVYEECLTVCHDVLEKVAEKRKEKDASTEIKVLHLGTGNSNLVEDLFLKYNTEKTTTSYQLVQVAVDYSPTVIENMKKKYEDCLVRTGVTKEQYTVHWVVADIRDLNEIRQTYGPCFDLVIDKGTMDALQVTDHNENENENNNENDVEENVHRMLQEVSLCLGNRPHSVFLQFTWQVPYYRLYYTTKHEEHQYAWGSNEQHKSLGDGGLYYYYIYEVTA